MKLQSQVKLLAIPAIIINSMLIGMTTAQANSSRGFTQTCTNIDIYKGRLFAICKMIDGRSRRSSINLNSYIANQKGVLVWSKGGKYLNTTNNCKTYSATSYNSTVPQSYLSCNASTRNSRNSYTILTLDEHIENINGQLQYFK